MDHQTDSVGNILATFTYDTSGEPTSVVVGAPTTGTRYSYGYNGHGDVVALVDTNGTVQASYSYDAFGNLTSSSETLANGWSNPYRYDGAEGVRYDPETGLYWMSVRAYDPTLGRFISHDPLGRLVTQGLDAQPYVYARNNPVNQTDPSGLFTCAGPMLDGHCRSYWHEHPNAPDTDGCKTGVGPYVQVITGTLVFLRNGFYAGRALLGSFWTYWAGVAAVDALEDPALTVVGSVMEVLTPFLGETGNAGWAMIGIAQMALANWKKESAEELNHWCAGDGGCGPEPTRYIYVVY